MLGKIKKIKNNLGNYIFPITRAEAVYVQDNKTLAEAILDGSISGGTTEISVNGRGYAFFTLRGAIINIRKNTDDNTCVYTFPTLDTDRYRRLFIWTSGATLKTIDIPDGALLDNDALIYDTTTNTLSTKNGSWGNISLTSNQYLLLYNNLGNISGILSKYVLMGGDNLAIPIRSIPITEISSTGSTQAIIIVEDKLLKCAHTATDDHTTYANIGVYNLSDLSFYKSLSQNIGHFNSGDYSASRNSLIVGNGSKSYSLLPKGWIIPNFNSIVNNVNISTLEFNTIDKIELDFSQFVGEYKGQLCWGYDNTDIVYLFTNDSRILRKIQLGKGTDNLGNGVYVDGTTTPNRYNGSYQVLNTWYSRTKDVLSDMKFYKGYIYIGVKGGNSIRKCITLNNGWFDSVYYPIGGSDVQGIDFTNDKVYTFTDSKGYIFDQKELEI